MDLQWRNSEFIEGPNKCGYYTAGIDIQIFKYDKLDWHLNAIEFHDKSKEMVEYRRNLVMARK